MSPVESPAVVEVASWVHVMYIPCTVLPNWVTIELRVFRLETVGATGLKIQVVGALYGASMVYPIQI